MVHDPATLDEDALAKAAGTLADLSPTALRRLVGMAGQPGYQHGPRRDAGPRQGVRVDQAASS